MTDQRTNLSTRRLLSGTARFWPWPAALLSLGLGLTVGAWSAEAAGDTQRPSDGDRYIASDGIVSYRLDLNDADDRRLLASLITRREGRIYAFEKASKVLSGRPGQTKRPMTLQVFDLRRRQDANRLSAAISSGRTTLFVARREADPADQGPDAGRDGRSTRAAHVDDQGNLAGAAGRSPAPGADRVARRIADGVTLGRRIDLAKSDDRARLAAMIAKQEGRVFSVEKGGPIGGRPDVFDFADSRSADRLASVISSNRHILFIGEAEPLAGDAVTGSGAQVTAEPEPAKPAAPIRFAAAIPELKPADFRPAPPAASADDVAETALAARLPEAKPGAGGPVQLMPRDRSTPQDFPVIAERGDTQTDAETSILTFVDEPTSGAFTSEGRAEKAQEESVVAALTEQIDVLGREPVKKPESSREQGTKRDAPATAPKRALAEPRDEAELIAAIERDKVVTEQMRNQPAGKPSPKTRAQSIEFVDAPKQTLDLAIGEGQLVRLPEPIAKMLIADPSVADARVMSDDLIYVFGNASGQTNIFGLTADQRVSADFDIRVGSNVNAARNRLKELQPDTMADFTRVAGQVVAQGLVRDPAEAYQVAALSDGIAGDGRPTLNNTVMPGAQQVNIRVRFAEVSRNDIERLGINWQAILDSGDFLFGLSSGSLFLPQGAINTTESFASIFGNGSFGDVDLDLFLEGLEREGIVNVLAEPNLTAINGRAANFLAGGEIPIPVPQQGDVITIDYKPFGVSLEFLPTLMPGNRINLQVRPEVSSIVDSGGIQLEGFNIPAFTVRRAETAIELASGQTFAIAGLFQRSVVSDVDKFPVVADVPVIGNLFKSPRFQRSETELVILITPYLVQPAPAATYALPNQRIDQSIPPVEPRHLAAGLGGFIIE